MSLRAWFQLDGDLSNKGISNAVATNDGATVDNNGKIGKCYAFNNTRIIIDSTDLQNIFTSSSQPFSFATWIYLNSDETDRVIIFGNYNANPFINWELLGNGTHRLCAGGTSNFTTKTNSTVVPKTTWTHIAVTYDGTITTFYQNGVSIGTASGANTITTKVASSRFYLGSDTRNDATRLKGKLCDFRCYDHCLSAAEVREIAQGLVLHYKLDGGLFGNPNLLLNTHFDNRYNQTTGWDTIKNGTLLAYSWGGYNSGAANQATCYHAHLKLFNNEYVYEYIKDTETWLGISQGGLQSKLTAGKTYTFSCEQYSVTNTNYMYGGLYYYKTGATSAGFHLGYIYCNTNRQQNTWQKYTYTFTAPSDGDYSKNMIWYCYGHSGGAGTFYLRHLKLEEGNAATPWCLADSELDIDRTIVEDSSGYNHNGTIIGDLIPITDTKRYTIATKWNSSAPTTNNNTGLCYIQTPLTLTTPSQMTIAWWGKPESGYGDSTGHAVFCTSNNETAPTDYNTTAFHHRDSGFDIYPSDGSGTKRLSFSYTKNEWHHYAVTYDGTTAHTYQDGELKSSITVGANKTLASFSQLYIGFSKAGGVWRKTLGSYSDFRVYITQLLDTDIKQLYNVGMKVDKLGNVHSFELNEQHDMIENAKFVNNSATSISYDEATDTYTIVSPVGTSSWGYGVRLADSPALMVPYGATYRWTAEVWTPIASNVNTDYNNTTGNSDTNWSGNDNDATGTRLTSSIAIPANKWTRIYRGSSNMNNGNTNHLPIRDYSSLGLVTNGQSGPVTWKVRHLQWYIADTGFKPQLKKTGIFEASHFTEVEEDLDKPAQLSKKMLSVNATQYIEK